MSRVDMKLRLQIETVEGLGWLLSACSSDARRTEDLEEKGGPVAAYGSRAYRVRPLAFAANSELGEEPVISTPVDATRFGLFDVAWNTRKRRCR